MTESICKNCRCFMQTTSIDNRIGEYCMLCSNIYPVETIKCSHFNPKPKNREKMVAQRKETTFHGKKPRIYKGMKGGIPQKKKESEEAFN